MLSLFALITICIALVTSVWTARLWAPQRIDVRSPGIITLGNTTIHLPVDTKTIESYIVMDGGTYGVRFIDDAGVSHNLASWHSMGEPQRHGEIIVGGVSPCDGGKSVGKIAVGEQLIFSLLKLEDWTRYPPPATVDVAYPSIGFIVTHLRHDIADRLGIP
jgi:hypothetical protein